jgi:murein L,D-transpeptidase YafK
MKIIFRLIFIAITGVLVYYFYPEEKLPVGVQIDRLVVYKSERQLLAYSDGKLIKTYTISLGKNPDGDKEFEGDERTPEGNYTINAKNPNSGYHKNLGISYPDKNDVIQAKLKGKPTGGDIKIHGLPNGQGYIGKFQRWSDWTWGCIALTNKEIDELYRSVEIGTPIEILP